MGDAVNRSILTSAEVGAADVGEDSINVLLTGFGPFPDAPINTSHEITKLLPPSIPANTSANPTTMAIKILNPTAEKGKYIPTSYKRIRNYVKHLHTFGCPPDGEENRSMVSEAGPYSKIDIVVHLGMADGWQHVTIERVAYGQGMSSSWWSPHEAEVDRGYYKIPDEYGETIVECGENPWTQVPMGLRPAFDIDDLQKGSAARLAIMQEQAVGKKRVPVVAHSEGGPYCCGFTHYESLANCWVLKKPAYVLFCHVPGERDMESLEAARDCIVAIVGSAVAQFLSRR